MAGASPGRVGYVDRQGRPINRRTWLALSARPEYVVVARDAVRVSGRRVHVLTMWLGLYLPTDQPPIFETLLQPSSGARPRTWTWTRLAQARTGHCHVVRDLKTGAQSRDQAGGASASR